MTYQDLRVADRLKRFKASAVRAQTLTAPNFQHSSTANSFQAQDGVNPFPGYSVAVPNNSASVLAVGAVIWLGGGTPVSYLIDGPAVQRAGFTAAPAHLFTAPATILRPNGGLTVEGDPDFTIIAEQVPIASTSNKVYISPSVPVQVGDIFYLFNCPRTVRGVTAVAGGLTQLKC